MFGLLESFSSNFPRRFCRSHKRDIKIMTKENSSVIRNRHSYAVNLDTNEPSETGIKFNSIINNIDGFHITENYFVDIMHDVLEGSANFGMSLVIHHYVLLNIFSLESLNNALKYFPFVNISNRPPPVKLSYLLRNDLGYSASEMLHLVMYFALIVGHFIPDECPVWKYYLALREIVCLLMLKSISSDQIEYLDILITEHHVLFRDLFKKDFKPKQHFMLHYSRIIKQSGPLSHNWCMRFESKHLEGKIYATVCRSRINLCKSLMIRHMFIFANFLYCKKEISEFYNVGPKSKMSNASYKWIIFKGTKYAIGNFVYVGDESNIPQFGKILDVQD